MQISWALAAKYSALAMVAVAGMLWMSSLMPTAPLGGQTVKVMTVEICTGGNDGMVTRQISIPITGSDH